MKTGGELDKIKNGFMEKFFTNKESLLKSIKLDFQFLKPIKNVLFCYAKL